MAMGMIGKKKPNLADAGVIDQLHRRGVSLCNELLQGRGRAGCFDCFVQADFGIDLGHVSSRVTQ